MSELLGVDCFMRYTDKEGRSHVQSHRVIAGGCCVKWATEEAVRNKGSAEQITQEQYEKARKG